MSSVRTSVRVLVFVLVFVLVSYELVSYELVFGVEVAHGEVDNRRVLLNVLLGILTEALDVDDQILRQPRDDVLAAVAVHHLLEGRAIELRQAREEGHLRERGDLVR